MVSCANKRKAEPESTDLNIKQEKETIMLEINKSDSLSEPVILEELKRPYQKYSTTGVLIHSEAEKLCPIDSTGFFGCYNLINKDNLEIIGELIVFTNDKPKYWHFNSKNETFISLSTQSSAIKVWNQSFINMSYSDLKVFIGERFHYKKGQTVYGDFGDFEGAFNLKNDTIFEFKINRKCKK